MTATVDPDRSSAPEGLLRFIERRCDAHVSVVPAIDADNASAQEATTGPPVLSMFEIDPGMDMQSAAEQDLLIILALKLRGEEEASKGRVVVRFVTQKAIRSAGRAIGAKWVASDIRIQTPAGLEEVSLLAYSLRRTPRLERVLAVVEDLVEAMGAWPDENLALVRALLDWLEVIDSDEGATIVLGGRGLRFSERGPGDESRGARYVALVSGEPGASKIDSLWLQDRRLRVGPDSASAKSFDGRRYILLRFGAEATQQSVSQVIEQILREAGEAATAAEGESYRSHVEKEIERRNQIVVDALYEKRSGPGTGQAQIMLPVVTPIAIEVASDLERDVALGVDSGASTPFQLGIEELRKHIGDRYGVKVPGVRVRLETEVLAPGSYTLMLHELPVAGEPGLVMVGKWLCGASASQLARRGVGGPQALHPGDGRPCTWVGEDDRELVEKEGLPLWEPAACITAHLKRVVRDNLAGFFGTQSIFDIFELADSDLFWRLEAARGGVARFRSVMTALLREAVPVKPLIALAKRYLELIDRPAFEIAEQLRCLPEVSQVWIAGLPEMKRVFRVNGSVSSIIRDGIVRDGDAALLALSGAAEQRVVHALIEGIAAEPGRFSGPVVLVDDWEARPFVRALLEKRWPRIVVASSREMAGHESLLPKEFVDIGVDSR